MTIGLTEDVAPVADSSHMMPVSTTITPMQHNIALKNFAKLNN